MNETTRTLIYVGVAAVVLLVAGVDRYSARSVPDAAIAEANLGKPMFADFQDPLKAKSLEIVTFDEAQASLRSFKVAQQGGRWVIPSHNKYPADAENQLRDAAAGLITVQPLGIATEVPIEHAEYGVVEPSSKLKVGAEGVGTLVTMQDAKEGDLLRLVIGKEVEGAPGQRFVRKPSEDVVYVAKVDLAKLPTEFDKWIEKDLLKLNAMDVSQLTLKDYSILPTQTGRPYYFPRMEATVAWNSEAGNWDLKRMLVWSKQTPQEAGLGEHEELNKQKLDDLKTAIDDLKIVDVVRKPEGLGASLTGGEDLVQYEEALAEFGFLLVPRGGDKYDIAASNGEVLVDMKDGVEYVLRFGKAQGSSKDAEAGKLNRFLFVTAQLAQSTLQPPAQPEAASPVPTDEAASQSEGEGGGADQAEDAADAKPAADPQDGATEDKTQEPAAPAESDDAAAREKREFQRQLDEYNAKRKKAEARVAELNARFADWYYVISEDVYKKIHLSRADIIKESSQAKEEGFDIDAFRKLEDEGINPPPPAAPSSPGGSPFGGGNPFGGLQN